MKAFNVLIDTTFGRPPTKKRFSLASLEVTATSHHAAGWELIRLQPGPVPIFTGAIRGVAEAGGPFIPWPGLLKDYDHRDKSTRSWACIAFYRESDSSPCIELGFQVCAATTEDVETLLSELDPYQPENLDVQMGINPGTDSILRQI